MIRFLIAALTLALPATSAGQDVQVAVAANFVGPMKQLASMFTHATGHTLALSVGSTGRFYAQIRNGAPFEVLLAADSLTPARLEAEGRGTDRFTYAVGTLVLWSRQPGRVDGQGTVLNDPQLGPLALADPRLSPYGVAARETLASLGLLDSYKHRWVQGDSIGQTYQFVASGNAPVGFVALSQVMQRNGGTVEGSMWRVPSSLHAPIQQDAILLTKGRHKPAALALMSFLQSAPARQVIRDHGYTLPGE